MNITREQLKAVMPNATGININACVGPINAALEEFHIDTPARIAAFIAQIAHETGELKYMREIWGPTKAQTGYEGRKDLGNTQPGDGKRYKGRGAFQLTGRANYRQYGKLLKLPLEEQPSLAELPENSFRIAGAYWNSRHCSELADKGEFAAITRAINGGLNGQAERLRFWSAAKKALA
jgi:putative chitinase